LASTSHPRAPVAWFHIVPGPTLQL
jgi:hypothetical protein